VLRYRLGGADAPTTYYGKVFHDGTGAVVERHLRALATAEGGGARFPRPVSYSPSHRLLCTEALPGEPLRRRLRAAGDGPSLGPERTAALEAAMATAGRALAALHRTAAPEAPVRSATDELAELRHELALVATVWPREAERIGRTLDALGSHAPEPGVLVLSHGDFTPSQVLLDGDRPGIVDLDTLCRSDPALDLGRFLAHVRLLVARLTGDPDAPLCADLSRAFLRGYGEEDGRSTAAHTGRVSFYIGTTLARSAVHACRQLKDERLDLAVELLHHVPLPEEVEL
jgi:aminoglycoside phosphotransferase (APT) family kinase protein